MPSAEDLHLRAELRGHEEDVSNAPMHRATCDVQSELSFMIHV